MENSEDQEQEGDEQAGGGFQAEQLRSYLAFGSYAIRKHWLTSAAVLAVGLGLTIVAVVYWPRTFSCSTVLMTVGNPILDGRDGSNALAGASDLVLRHGNLETIIRENQLVPKIDERRPPILKFKDGLLRAIFGPPNEKLRVASVVGTLENKITVTADKGDLTIKVEWTDGRTAAELAEASRESFLRARHTAEISAFEEKMAILEGHATRLRDEVGALAQQLKTVRDQKVNEVRAEQSEANKASKASAPKLVLGRPAPRRTIEPDEQTPALKEQLEALQTKLAAIEADREQRLRQEQAKLDDLKLRLMPSHPDFVNQENKVALLSQVPSDLALLRAEAKDLAAEIQQREGLRRSGTEEGGQASAGGSALSADGSQPLPPDITDLLARDNLDPALTAQLSSTVMKYGALRNDILTTRIELDTAQAAFNHRYQIIVPAEVPPKPDKPKPAVIFGGGFVLSLLLSLLLPLLAELRRGVMVERWQVQHLQLPILAELRLPPYSSD